MAGPIRRIQLQGTDLQIAIWGGGDITISRSYKDKSGNWKKTEFLKAAHIAVLAALAPSLIATSMAEANKPKPVAEPEPMPEPEGEAVTFDDDIVPF